MRFGYFDDKNREYVITRPDTPLPWINYLGCEAYFGIISNTAGGYSFYKDARLRRITRYRYNNIPCDSGGRYIYLRDNDRKEYWSPTWQPTRNNLEYYYCRHGLGYTVIGSTFREIETRIRYFVPLGENLEIWQLNIKNDRNIKANLSIFSFIEFCLWDAHDDANNFQRNLNTGEVEVEDGVIYHKTEYRERRNHFAFFACSGKLEGLDTRRDAFLGNYGDLNRPLVVEKGESYNSIAHGWSPIGSHHVKLDLNPGETKELIFILGYYENPEDQKFDPEDSQVINKKNVKKIIARYLSSDTVNDVFNTLHSYWDKLLDVIKVKTPDIHLNRMINIWNAYQCMITFNIARSASFFESGTGRGMGFRDCNQDILGFVHMVPERARERILDLIATQLQTGAVYHQYQPLTKRGNHNIGSGFNDDPLWMIISVAEYLKETGDISILDEMISYDNTPGTEQPLIEHLQRSIQYIRDRIGPHNLPLIGRADWNDCLNLNCFSSNPDEPFQIAVNKDGAVAESVFIAGLFITAAKEISRIFQQYGSKEDVKRYRDWAIKMESAVRDYGWDGRWFLRAYDDFGEKIGSKECTEGKIFVESQGMCIMAGIGLEDGKAAQALEAVNKLLASSHGIHLLYPPYSRYYHHLGEISSYPPGYKENGSIFCHTNPWIIIAETMVGNGDQAFDYYLRINPSAREEISEVHCCEPYVYAQMIAGCEAETYGEAKNSWLTGTAAWNYAAVTKWILGIKPTYTGLEITPVIPREWKGYEAKRVFRGVTYHIAVERIGKGNNVTLQIDGKPIEGNIIPVPTSGKKDVNVRVKIV
ncbi:MAG: GH36-type glycosyl hydrolase domain-containing protein [Candidatus Odinarchaeota archaeon]